MSDADARDLFERGAAAYHAGDFHEALTCLTRAIALRPTAAAGYRYRAYAYLGLKDRARAVADLDQAVKLTPDDAQLRAERAAELLKQRSHDAAIADCDAALRLDPGRADVYGIRGRCHAAAGDSEKAAADFATAAAMDPDHAADYLTDRAKLRYECGRPADAAADADAALNADPGHVPALEIRAMARQQLDDLDGAAADFREAARLNPKSIAGHLGYGLVALRQEKWDEAAAAADELLAARPNFPQALELRGLARKEQGDLAGSLADFDAMIAAAPNRAAGYSLRGSLHAARGDHTAAVRDHLAALQRDPRAADSLNQLAWLWATASDPGVRNGTRAKECATRACEMAEWANPGYLDTLAAACAELSEFADAVAWQEKAVALAGPADATTFRDRLNLYRGGKPYRPAV